MIVDLNESFYFPNLEYGTKTNTKEKFDAVLEEFFESYDYDIKKIMEALIVNKEKKEAPVIPKPTPFKDALNETARSMEKKEIFSSEVDVMGKAVWERLHEVASTIDGSVSVAATEDLPF